MYNLIKNTYEYFKNKTVYAQTKVSYEYKKKNSYENRYIKSKEILKKHDDYIPIILETINESASKSIVIPRKIITSQLLIYIKKQLVIDTNKSVILKINNEYIPSSIDILGDLYDKFKDNDGFLYITFIIET